MPAFLKCADFYKAHRSEKRGVLWFCDDVTCPFLHSGVVQILYNDLYYLFISYHVITMSAFVIGETTNNKRYSKLVFESLVANSLNMKTYLQAVSQKRQTVFAKLELPHFIETAGIVGYSSRFRK